MNLALRYHRNTLLAVQFNHLLKKVQKLQFEKSPHQIFAAEFDECAPGDLSECNWDPPKNDFSRTWSTIKMHHLHLSISWMQCIVSEHLGITSILQTIIGRSSNKSDTQSQELVDHVLSQDWLTANEYLYFRMIPAAV